MNCSLYIHVPFCVRKCLYCAFYSVPGSIELQERYTAAIKQELQKYDHQGPFETVFLGGGSPSAMNPSILLDLVKWAAQYLQANAEFTVEVNPGQTSPTLFEHLKSCRVNRISIGAQSFDDKELAFLGRIHSAADIVRCIADARNAGFTNIGLDLIFAIPGLTTQQWKKTLDKAIEMRPQHISAYSLTYEGDTPLVQSLNAGKIEAIDEETDRQMYELTIDTLQSAGFEQYEISNFAKPGFQCRHNMRYWQNQPYIGLGPAAAGWYNGKRTENVADIDRWLHNINKGQFAHDNERILSAEEIACETAVLNLRTRFGIDSLEFQRQTGYDMRQLFSEPVTKYLNESLLEWHNGRLRLTRQALPIADKVLCDFAAL